MSFKVVLAAGLAFALAGQALADERPNERLRATMDSAFGSGNWRMTGGYRTQARENELRAQGALTVRPGGVSRHSIGRPGAPGAYDLVVNGLSPAQAAARLRQINAPFRRYMPKGQHGTQGPHLHVEPYSLDLSGAGAAGGPAPRPAQQVYAVRDPTPAERALIALHTAADDGLAEAQLELGTAYAEGRTAPRDLVAAYVWTAQAAANKTAEPALRDAAAARLKALSGRMKPAEVAWAQRFAPAGGGACDAPPARGIVLAVSGRTLAPERAACPTGRAAVAGR